MIKGIIFDLGGVVVSDKIRDYVHTTAANYYGVTIEEMRETINKHEKDFNIPNWDEDEYWKSIANDLGISNSPPPRHIWTENYAESTPPNEKVIELIRRLKAKGYRLCVLSNTVQTHVDVNRKRGLYDLFDVEVFSCDPEVNSKKPDIKIYQMSMKRMKLAAGECIFIDDKERYLIPAKKLGMYTILYQKLSQLEANLRKLSVNL